VIGVVAAPGRTASQLAAMVRDLLERSAGPVFATRTAPEQYAAIRTVWPQATRHARSGLLVVRPVREPLQAQLAVVTAGTSDLAVAEEAAGAARALGLAVTSIADVGVAGLHRLLAHRSFLQQVDCVIVAAGMDGALASVTAGLVACPVIALPTSIGYGTSFGGVAALVSMVSSCTPGVAVVNVDDGVAAAVVAWRILGRCGSRRSGPMS
jgi:pyridinium-3,5-biscarboxylic acid mononucleotide synthase